MPASDKSNGYEAIASLYLEARGNAPGGIGAPEIADWARTLPPGATVLDIACGTGLPVTLALINCGLNVYALDASPSMVAAFRRNFPNVPVECSAVEDFDFFGRTFDAAVSWGLMFLLEPETQRNLIATVAAHLVP